MHIFATWDMEETYTGSIRRLKLGSGKAYARSSD
jgi:hypothetical protein